MTIPIDFTHTAACGCRIVFLAPEYRAFRTAMVEDCKRHSLAACCDSPELAWACRQLVAEAKTALAEWLVRKVTGADNE